jgi:hypothetical protein
LKFATTKINKSPKKLKTMKNEITVAAQKAMLNGKHMIGLRYNFYKLADVDHLIPEPTVFLELVIFMAVTMEPDPVLHCIPDDFLANNLLSMRVLNYGMYTNATIFTAIPVPVTDFKPAAILLSEMLVDPKASSSEKVAQSRIVHKYLKKNLLYAKQVCDHDPAMIEKTGYDSNFQASKTGAVETAGIVRVQKGKIEGTYKVVLKRKSNKKLVDKDPKTHPTGALYTVELSLTPDDPKSWVAICCNAPSTKLILNVKDLFQGKKNYVRVYGVNRAGRGNTCDPFFFTPEVL